MTPLAAWDVPQGSRSEPLGDGLINETFRVVHGGDTVGVLQRLNTDIFRPTVHLDIQAITAHLKARGLPTTELVPTRSGDLWHTADDGSVWRMLSWVGDRTVSKVDDPADAHSGGALIARFHAALSDLDHRFHHVRPGAHDTDRHMDTLMRAMDAHRSHRLWWEATDLGETILEGWRRWEGPTDLPTRIIHGDLKISNLRFAGSEALALVDLDTLQDGGLDAELGDAMRSWCNPRAENVEDASFDAAIFAAAMEGYASERSGVTRNEWLSIGAGTERICWELAARFAADALNESYFGWDPAYGTRGDHNLLRARGQASLARSVRDQRAALDAKLQELWG